jgi:ribosomal-protein-alanine N-acetyltransferase
MIDRAMLDVRPMTDADAGAVASWRYTGDWSIYNLASQRELVNELACYRSVFLDTELIGFCCVGQAARVPGLPADAEAVDVGMGMKPTLVGRGNGQSFGQAVLRDLDAVHPNGTFRAVVQAWNTPSLQLSRRLGFGDAGQLTVIQGGRPVAYRVVVRYRRREGD